MAERTTNPARDLAPTAPTKTWAVALGDYAVAGRQLSRVAWDDGRVVTQGDGFTPSVDDTLAMDWFVVRG